jgi:hypothetical protein
MKFDVYTYQPAFNCTGGETPGTRALQNFLLVELNKLPGCETIDSGIYNCRNIGDTGQKSVHSEGRAGDTGVRLPGGGWPRVEIAEPGIWKWANRLIDRAEELGIQYVIYAQRACRPGQTWRPYTGASPHFDHIHWELTRQAAQALTPQYVQQVLGEEDGDDMADPHIQAALASLAVSDIYAQHADRPVESAAAREFHVKQFLASSEPVDYLTDLAKGLESEDSG